jgi:hypothetical protein
MMRGRTASDWDGMRGGARFPEWNWSEDTALKGEEPLEHCCPCRLLMPRQPKDPK